MNVHYSDNRKNDPSQGTRLGDGAFDAVLESGLTLCVEALVGEIGGDHMVKLEDQGVITDDGFETM